MHELDSGQLPVVTAKVECHDPRSAIVFERGEKLDGEVLVSLDLVAEEFPEVEPACENLDRLGNLKFVDGCYVDPSGWVNWAVVRDELLPPGLLFGQWFCGFKGPTVAPGSRCFLAFERGSFGSSWNCIFGC